MNRKSSFINQNSRTVARWKNSSLVIALSALLLIALAPGIAVADSEPDLAGYFAVLNEANTDASGAPSSAMAGYFGVLSEANSSAGAEDFDAVAILDAIQQQAAASYFEALAAAEDFDAVAIMDAIQQQALASGSPADILAAIPTRSAIGIFAAAERIAAAEGSDEWAGAYSERRLALAGAEDFDAVAILDAIQQRAAASSFVSLASSAGSEELAANPELSAYNRWVAGTAEVNELAANPELSAHRAFQAAQLAGETCEVC